MEKQKLTNKNSVGRGSGNKKTKPEKKGSGCRACKKIRKDITICFRTSVDVRNYVESIAVEKRQSLSYVIESILCQHQKDSGSKLASVTEHRRFSRRYVALPAIVSSENFQEKSLDSGTVLDVSLGGLRFAIPKKPSSDVALYDQNKEYNVFFTLPEQNRSIAVRCKTQHISNVSDEVHIGAAFVDADFNCYQNLQNYLI
jgi:hypothetical protein